MSEMVRVVLLERYIFRPSGGSRADAIEIFGRALWSGGKTAPKIAKFTGWVSTIRESSKTVHHGLRMRTVSRKGILTPVAAQEWAFEAWDAYVHDLISPEGRAAQAARAEAIAKHAASSPRP
jgi:hypothetical protein